MVNTIHLGVGIEHREGEHNTSGGKDRMLRW